MLSQNDSHHRWQILDDLLSVLLNAYSCSIPLQIKTIGKKMCGIRVKSKRKCNAPAWMSILTSDNRSNAWFSVVAHRGMGHVRSQENHLWVEQSQCSIPQTWEKSQNIWGFFFMCLHVRCFTHGLVENFWSDGRNQNGVHSSQFHINLRQNDYLLLVLPIWTILPWDTDWRGSGVKSCSHSSPEDKIEFWNYPIRVQTQVLLSKAKKKRDLNTLRSHPQNSVTHSFDLHTRIWSFVKMALMNIQIWYFSGWYNFYQCWPNGNHCQ